ncbi:MAG: hypothetical protein JEZ07_17910 [Phycisphaerae bacterium]|nr:hypothetical protein [Phycisphaerae bacterium]
MKTIGKMCLAIGITTLLSTYANAGNKIDAWVIEDFESYETSSDMIGSPMELFTGACPWAKMQDVAGWEPGLKEFDVSLAIHQDDSDPNGFLPVGGTDDDGPQGMAIHTKVDGYASGDMVTLCATTGLPITSIVDAYIPNGQGGYAPYQFGCIDFTEFDTISLKVKRRAGVLASEINFAITFIGPDLKAIGYLNKDQAFPITEGNWEILEFDLTAEPIKTDDPSAVDMTAVAILAFGSFEVGTDTDLNYIIDDITISKKSATCPEYIQADINLDCVVNLQDIAMLASDWLAGN